MARVRRERVLVADPATAEQRWSEPGGWEAWVDGLRHVEWADPAWPQTGTAVRWRSGPRGRGTVSERVLVHQRGRRLEVAFEDDRMQGTQTAEFRAEGAGCRLILSFHYTVKGAGPVGAVVDLLFVRRVVGEVLERTLDAFAAELGPHPAGRGR